MIKFLGQELTDQEAYEKIIDKLSFFIKSEELILEALNDIGNYCDKQIREGKGMDENNSTADAIGMMTFSAMKKMLKSQCEKEDKKWEKMKQKGKVSAFIKDNEKSDKSVEKAIDGIATTIKQANHTYSPSVLKVLVETYKDMTEWGLRVYQEQLDWAKENLLANNVEAL